MTATNASDMLARFLELTREEELDCDGFLERIAAFAEGNVEDPRLHALMEHHREFCPECAEELAILQRAIGEGEGV